MPRFPLAERLGLPAIFEGLVPGRLHPDGRRYLPLILLRLQDGTLIGVVDRHHRVDPALEGRRGSARLVFLLSGLAAQPPGQRRLGLDPGPLGPGEPSTSPDIYGEVLAVPTWESDDRAGIHTLYTELLLGIGQGVVGVRTSQGARTSGELLGGRPVAVGDWLQVRRSRIDILEFVPGRDP